MQKAISLKIFSIIRAFRANSIQPTLRDISWNIFFIVIYFLAGKLGLLFASINPSVSVIWPPTGIAIAIILLFGYRAWPSIFIGAFLTNITTAGSFFTSFTIAGGNTLEAIVGVYLVNKYAGGKGVFENIFNTIKFITYAVLASTLISPTVGVLSLVLSDLASSQDFFSIWLTWWLGDIGGAIILAPLIILWGNLYFQKCNMDFLKQLFELIFVYTLLILTVGIIFNDFLFTIPNTYQLAFLIIPPLLWIALRFRRRVTVTTIFIVDMMAIYGTLHGYGAFGNLGAGQSLLFLQIFLIVVSGTMLLVSVLVTERFETHRSIVAKERRFHSLIEKSPSGIILLDRNGMITYSSSSVERLLGFKMEDFMGTCGTSLFCPQSDGTPTEMRFRHKDGSWMWIEATKTDLLSDPDVNSVVVNFRDITEKKQLREKKNQFLSLVSHQLHTPLENIRRYAQCLLEKKGKVASIDQKYIQEIDHSGIEMKKFVDNLLKIFRIEVGILDMQPRTTKLREEVEEVVRRVAYKLSAKEIKIEKRFVLQGVVLNLDPFIFTSLLSTLILETIEHIPAKGSLAIEFSEHQTHPSIKIIPSARMTAVGKKINKTDILVAKTLAAYMGMDIVNDGDASGNLTVVLP